MPMFLSRQMKTALLAGCAAVVLAGPVVANDEATKANDLRLEAQIERRYSGNEHLRSYGLDAQVVNSMAFIFGTVRTSAEAELAAEIARGTTGITLVDSRLRIDAQQGNQQTERSGSVINDAAVTARVKSRLLLNKNTAGLAINVTTKNKRVSLDGVVLSAIERDLAAEIARNTDGVRSVQNNLQVDTQAVYPAEQAADVAKDTGKATGEAFSEAGSVVVEGAKEGGNFFSDRWITSKLKSRMLMTKGVPGLKINVDTKDGVVSLYGTVDKEEHRYNAGRLAELTKGVREVKNNIRVRGELP